MEFIAGVEAELSARWVALMIQLVARPGGGDRGLPALVGRAAGRRGHAHRPRAATTRASPRSSGSACPRSSSGGPLGRRGLPVGLARRGRRPGRGRPLPRGARPRAHRAGRGAWATSSTTSSAPRRFGRRPPSWASSAESSTPTTRPRAAPARRGQLLSRPGAADGDRLRQRRARRDGPRRRAPDGVRRPGGRLDRRLGRLAHLPVVHPPLTAVTPGHRRRTARPSRVRLLDEIEGEAAGHVLAPPRRADAPRQHGPPAEVRRRSGGRPAPALSERAASPGHVNSCLSRLTLNRISDFVANT